MTKKPIIDEIREMIPPAMESLENGQSSMADSVRKCLVLVVKYIELSIEHL